MPKIYKMSEIHLKCQYAEDDIMIVSKGVFFQFETIQDGENMVICLDEKQVYILKKYLETYSNEKSI